MRALPLATRPMRRDASQRRATRPTTRFALHCEPLETRQLLSIGQTSLGASVLASPTTAFALVSAPVAVSNSTPSGLPNSSVSGVATSDGQSPIVSVGTANSTNSANVPIFVTGNANGNEVNGGDNVAGFSPLTSSTITPLNPTDTSSTASSTEPQPDVTVFVIPPPLAPPVLQLGPSTTPTTTVSNSTSLSNLDAQPPSATHFGQGDPFGGRRLYMEGINANRLSLSLIDNIDPLPPAARVNGPEVSPVQPVDAPAPPPAPPVDAPKAPPAPQGDQPPAPDATNVRPLPPTSEPDVEATLDLTDARVLTRSHDGDASAPNDRFASTNTSWSFSVLFGFTVVASGGYHFAIRQADRLKGRSIPRWVGAERPNKRKNGLSSP
jgi:hypothetical protein